MPDKFGWDNNFGNTRTQTRRPRLIDRVIIPQGVYFNVEHDNFYNAAHQGMGEDFFREWRHRAAEFPAQPLSAGK